LLDLRSALIKHRYGKQESMGLNKTVHILPLPRFLNIATWFIQRVFLLSHWMEQ